MAFLKQFFGKKTKLQKKLDKGRKKKAKEVVGLPKKEAGKAKEQKPVVPSSAKKEAKKEAKEAAVKKPPIRTAAQPPQERPVKKRETNTASRVLKYPQITEKATRLQEENKYVFKVSSDATKPEIKKSIEEVYGVDVLQIRVINVSGKRKRLGRSRGWQSGYKKAIVKVKKGQSVEVLPR